MSCVCARYDGNGRFECSITGDGCLFLIPNQKLCHEKYGDVDEPDVSVEEGGEVMIKVDCRKCVNCTGEGCVIFGNDADTATQLCADHGFVFHIVEAHRAQEEIDE